MQVPVFIIAQILSLLVIGLILSIPLFIQWIRQRHKIKNSGISPDMPGCPKCLYIVRGWESPVCPECGTNVKGQKVRIGVVLSKKLIVMNAIVASLLLVLIVLMPIGGWLFRTIDKHESWDYTSSNLESIVLKINYSSKYRRFPPKDESDSMLQVESEIAIDPGDLQSLNNNQDVEIMNGSHVDYYILHFDKDNKLPASQEISEFLGKTLNQDASAMSAYADEITILLGNYKKTGDAQFTGPSTGNRLLRRSRSGSRHSRGVWPPGIIFLAIVGLLVIVLLPIRIVRRYKPGLRPVYNGEWSTSADPERSRS